MISSWLCVLLISMMFTRGQCDAHSMSCSTVNGVTHCTENQSAGNVAMGTSMAGTGGSGTYQSSMSSTGNTGTGQMSSVQMSSGNIPNIPAPGMMFGPMFGQGGGAMAGAGAMAGGIGPGGFNPINWVFGRR